MSVDIEIADDQFEGGLPPPPGPRSYGWSSVRAPGETTIVLGAGFSIEAEDRDAAVAEGVDRVRSVLASGEVVRAVANIEGDLNVDAGTSRA